MSSQLVIWCALLLAARAQPDFENGAELGYPASSNYEALAGHSYRSGKNEGLGVPAGGGAALDAVVDDGVAGQGNGVLRRQNVHRARPCDDAALVRECGCIPGIRADGLWPREPGRMAGVRHEVLPRTGIDDIRGGDFRVARAGRHFCAEGNEPCARASASRDRFVFV